MLESGDVGDDRESQESEVSVGSEMLSQSYVVMVLI
jgi:hypothetical protein